MANVDFDIKGVFKMLVSIVGLFAVYRILLLLFLGIYGAIANVFTSGTIETPEVIGNLTNDSVTETATNFATLGASDAVALSLITIIVILMVFRPVIGDYLSKKGKGGKSIN